MKDSLPENHRTKQEDPKNRKIQKLMSEGLQN